MVSSVRPRPNYYDVLGLPPSASQDEIQSAFGRVMGMFGAHPLAAAAELSAAFETLRNPEKRRAYDDALRLKREATPRHWSMAIRAEPTRGFVASAPGPTEKRSSDALARLARLAEPQPLARTAAPATPTRGAPSRPTQERSDARLDTHIEAMLAAHDGEAEDQRFAWIHPALVVGGLFVAAGLIGALAGSSAMEPTAPSKAQASVGRTKSAAAALSSNGGPSTAAAQAPIAQSDAFQPAAAPSERARPVRHLLKAVPAIEASALANSTPPSEQVADDAPDATPAPEASDSSAAASPAVATIASAGLPIAGKLMAKTIERIGYACGDVASATVVEGGGAGVYKVTCTSGDTYRAAPRHGRYRFKRWSSQ